MAIKYNLKIFVNKTKAMALKGMMNVRTKIVINNIILEEVYSFNYLGYTITVSNNTDLEIKMNGRVLWKLRVIIPFHSWTFWLRSGVQN
jgi:hypothetical protein